MVEKTGIRNEVAILDSRESEDGDLITISGFFDHPTACVRARKVAVVER